MSNLITSINSLSAGEVSPSLLGRVDLDKYQHGCFTCRNFFANYKGGISSRAGLAYVGTCLQSGTDWPPRDIPFQFNIFQGYVLEFGEAYLRFKYNGAYVTEGATNVSSVSASAGFTTTTPHGFSVGDWVYDTGNTGFSGMTWIVNAVSSATTFGVSDLFGMGVTSATASGAGTIARIYTLDTIYHGEDLPYLKYVQSADTMTITCVNTDREFEYVPQELVRHDHADWEFSAITFASSVSAPTGLVATASSSNTPTTWYSYVVTAVSLDGGEESVASTPAYVQNNDIAVYAGSNTLTWTGVTGITNYNIYAATPSYTQNVVASSSYGFVGTSNGPSFTDTNIVPDFTSPPPQHTNPFERGAITSVNITAGGTNYDQTTVAYNITPASGTGFSGTPIVSNGAITGFLIYNHGKNYQATDVLNITESSGGGRATGTLTFSAKPVDGNSLLINGVTVTFKNPPFSGMKMDSSSSTVYSEIESTKELTVQNLANVLNAASVVLSLQVASYTAANAVLTITYNTPGSPGNAYTLPANTAYQTRSAATLAGGGAAAAGATTTLNVSGTSGTYPSVASYFQSRRVFAASLNFPETYWMSQPGLYSNFDTSVPVIDSDAITGTPWAQQVNGLQFLLPMPGGLVVLTGKGAWQLSGGQSNAITPSNQNAVPQAYNGCHNNVQPVIVNEHILYVQAKGTIVRDFTYNIFQNIYTGTDITILSNHLFTGHQIDQWCYAEEPFKLVWAIRDDGKLLSLTYLKEQDIYAWTRHDTNGIFVSVCSTTEPYNTHVTTNTPSLIDSVYCIVKRYVRGVWKYYSERFDNRLWEDAESSFCVDSGLTNTPTYPDGALFISAASGEDVDFLCDNPVFTAGDVGSVIRAGGGIATVTSYVFNRMVRCTVTQDISDVLPNDPDNTPAPINNGAWTITAPFTVLSGLNHLEGKEVAILGDGSVVPNQTVVNGSITLDNAVSRATVGLPYQCQAQTLYVEHPDGNSTIQNRRKDIAAVGLRVEGTRGLKIGVDQPDASAQQENLNIPWTNMVEIKDRLNSVLAGNATPLYTGDYYQAVAGTWSVKGQLAVQQDYPLPANILSAYLYFSRGDDK